MHVEECSVKATSQIRQAGLLGLFSRPVIERVWLPHGQPKIGRGVLIELELAGWGALQLRAGRQPSEVRYKSWLRPGRHKIELVLTAYEWIDVSFTNLFGTSRTHLHLEQPSAFVDPRRFDSPQLARSSMLTLKSFDVFKWREAPPLLRTKRIRLGAKFIPLKARPIEMPRLLSFDLIFKPDQLRARIHTARFSHKIQAVCASPMQLDELLHESRSDSDRYPKES